MEETTELHTDACKQGYAQFCYKKLKMESYTTFTTCRRRQIQQKKSDEENIQHLQIATGVPRGIGQVERINRTLIPVLTKLSLDNSTKWYKYVDRLQRILNSTICHSTKWTPFELLVGTKMRNREDILIKDLLLEEMAKELLEQSEFLRNDAKKTSKLYCLEIERRITEEERKLRYTKKPSLRHIGNIFSSSLNTEINRSVLKYWKRKTSRRTFFEEGLSSLREDDWSP
ncbi:integrase catalytic domain-containing protein [Trichonephila clavipes]|nr:integrase catalytic domain-containing protein [Trichonephila clavipes]